MNSEPLHFEDRDKLQLWWELSYAKYLTVPRCVMQSMPDDWQGKMADLLNEMDDTIDWRPSEGRYWVALRGDDGRRMSDPLDVYRHRPNLPHKPKPEPPTDQELKTLSEIESK